MATNITVAVTPEAREAVFRFRYQVYVCEMGRVEPHACHRSQRLTDPMDSTALILVATDAGANSAVGTARVNLIRNGGAGAYERLYGLDQMPPAERHVTSITTRLMVGSEHRGSALALQLALAAYRHGSDAGIKTDFIDCNDPLVAFFSRLGYRWLRHLSHPQYGRVNLMKLTVSDVSHYRVVKSPFLRLHQA